MMDQKEVLGVGTYGNVVEAIHIETRQKRACKIIPKRKIKDSKTFDNEVEMLRKLDHPHILKLYEYFEDDRHMYLVTELCTGGELFDKI